MLLFGVQDTKNCARRLVRFHNRQVDLTRTLGRVSGGLANDANPRFEAIRVIEAGDHGSFTGVELDEASNGIDTQGFNRHLNQGFVGGMP